MAAVPQTGHVPCNPGPVLWCCRSSWSYMECPLSYPTTRRSSAWAWSTRGSFLWSADTCQCVDVIMSAVLMKGTSGWHDMVADICVHKLPWKIPRKIWQTPEAILLLAICSVKSVAVLPCIPINKFVLISEFVHHQSSLLFMLLLFCSFISMSLNLVLQQNQCGCCWLKHGESLI